jgi:putative transposase
VLPGYLRHGKPATPPRLSLPELDTTIGDYFLGTYNNRPHREISIAPIKAWLGQGWLPRMPESLEALDLLLVMVAQSRMVRRDGVHFQGLRYMDPTLAAYVGESVTIRYDPRDIAEIRVFHRNHFLCRAINPEHAGRTVTLKDIQTARARHRRSLRTVWFPKTCNTITTMSSEHANSGCPPLLMLHWTSTMTVCLLGTPGRP